MGLKKYDEEAYKAQEEAKEASLKKLEEEKNKAKELNEEVRIDDEVIIPDEIPEIDEGNLLDNEKELTNAINAYREDYKKYYKKQKIVRTLITVGTLVFLSIGLVIFLLQKKIGNMASYIGIAVIMVGLVASFICSTIFKKKLENKAREYMKNYCVATNKYLFNNPDFKDVNIEANKQMDPNLFVDAHFYKNIRNTRSRNHVTLTYKDKPMVSCDLAGNIVIKNRTSPMFLGKYYDYECNYSKENGIILFQLKGKELSKPIDNIDDLVAKENNSRYVIYSNDEEYRKILNNKVLTELLKFKIDDTLIDVIFSIRNGKVDLGIDYSDDFINIPVESEFKINNIKRAKLDLERVLKIFDLLNK